jgi:hypothetical protein
MAGTQKMLNIQSRQDTMSRADGAKEKLERSSSTGGRGLALQKILLLKLGDTDKGTVQKKFWSMKKNP